MAQFDVHRNRGQQRIMIPYLLAVQSRRFDASGRRVVVPLLASEALAATDPGFTPSFLVEGRMVVLNPLSIASIPVGALGDWVCSLQEDGDRIIGAIDLLISRAWG